MSNLPIQDDDDVGDDELPPNDVEIDRSVIVDDDITDPSAELLDEDDVEQQAATAEDVEPLDPDDPVDLVDVYRAIDENATPKSAKVDIGGAALDDETNPHVTGS